MRWSFSVARISGIDLRIHITFFLIFLLAGAQWSTFGLSGVLFGSVLILLLFACVTMHEFGHALAAQRLGVGVREIVLLPIGGVAVLSRNPSTPLQELLITVAGPLVNVAIAFLLAVVLTVKIATGLIDVEGLLARPSFEPSATSALIWLLNANIALVLFNMIPAFPLDGGRVFRAILGFFMPWSRATSVATLVGQGMALLLGLLAFVTGMWILMLIAALIFFSAGSTRAYEQARSVLSTCRVGDAFNRHALVLFEHDRLGTVVDYLLTSYQPDYAVLRHGELLGVVRRADAMQALATMDEDTPVTRIMLDEVPRLSEDLPLDEASLQLSESGAGVGAVYGGRRFLGLVSTRDIAEASAILACFRVPRRAGTEVISRASVALGEA